MKVSGGDTELKDMYSQKKTQSLVLSPQHFVINTNVLTLTKQEYKNRLSLQGG